MTSQDKAENGSKNSLFKSFYFWERSLIEHKISFSEMFPGDPKPPVTSQFLQKVKKCFKSFVT